MTDVQGMAGGGTNGMASGAAGNMRVDGGMASGGNGSSMTDVPRDYQQDNNNFQQKEYKASFASRFFFQDGLRVIELQLQSLGPTKKDVVDSNAFSISEYGFFLLHFQMIPVISVNMLGVIFSIILFFLLFKVSSVLAIIASFLLIQLIVIPNANIIYSLDRFKIGEKETGRFIKVVRKMWHLFELKIIIITITLGILSVLKIDYIAIATKLSNFEVENKFVNNLLGSAKNHIDFIAIANDTPSAISGLLILFLLSIIFYIITSYKTFKKNSGIYEKNVFSIKKEFMNPADLARDKFKF